MVQTLAQAASQACDETVASQGTGAFNGAFEATIAAAVLLPAPQTSSLHRVKRKAVSDCGKPSKRQRITNTQSKSVQLYIRQASQNISVTTQLKLPSRKPSQPKPSPSKRLPKISSTLPLTPLPPPPATKYLASKIDPIAYWVEHKRWPPHLFRPEILTRPKLDYGNASAKNFWELMTSVGCLQISAVSIIDVSERSCQRLLAAHRIIPDVSYTVDGITALKLDNKGAIARLITPLVVPSLLTIRHNDSYPKEFEILAETFGSGWKSCEPLHDRVPQPDQTLGFGKMSFTEDQLRKLGYRTGEHAQRLGCLAARDIFFPFFTSHFKTGDLDPTHRQNIFSAVTSLKSLVKLMRAVGRVRELDRQVYFFSIAYNQKGFEIFGHFAIIDGENTNYYRHQLLKSGREGDFSKAYQFLLSVYCDFGQKLHQLICSAVDQLPEPEPEDEIIGAENGESSG